jgi:hypothetical protein
MIIHRHTQATPTLTAPKPFTFCTLYNSFNGLKRCANFSATCPPSARLSPGMWGAPPSPAPAPGRPTVAVVAGAAAVAAAVTALLAAGAAWMGVRRHRAKCLVGKGTQTLGSVTTATSTSGLSALWRVPSFPKVRTVRVAAARAVLFHLSHPLLTGWLSRMPLKKPTNQPTKTTNQPRQPSLRISTSRLLVVVEQQPATPASQLSSQISEVPAGSEASGSEPAPPRRAGRLTHAPTI